MNRFSQIQFGETGSPINQEFLHDTLSTLQQKYDQGFMTVAKTIDTYNSLPIVTPRDKERMNQKINSLTEQLNGYGNADLADAKVVADLTLKAQSLARDPETMRIVNSNKNIGLLQERWEKIKNNPKLAQQYWNPLNEQLDNQRVKDYMDGKVDRFDQSTPTLYVDVNKIATDIAKGINATVEYKIGPDGFIVNGRYRHASDIAAIERSQLESNAGAMQQLNIQADALFNANGYAKVGASLKEDYNSQRTKLNDAITAYEREAGKTGDATKKAEYTELKKLHEKALKNLNTRIGEVDGFLSTGNEQELRALYREKYFDNFVGGIAKGNEIKEEKITANPHARDFNNYNYAMMKLGAEQAHREKLHNEDMAIKREQMKTGYQIAALKVTGKTLSEGQLSSVMNGGSIDLGSIVPGSSEVNNDENPLATIGNEISTMNSVIHNKLKGLTLTYLKDTLGGEDLEAYRRVEKQWNTEGGDKPNPKNAKLTKAQIDIVTNASNFMDVASDPARIQELYDNPNLEQYASLLNDIQKEAFTKGLLETQIKVAKTTAFNEFKKKNPNTTLTEETYANTLSQDFQSDKYVPTLMGYNSTAKLNTSSQGYVGGMDAVNNILKQKNVTAFYPTQMIGDNDKEWNKGSVKNNTVMAYAKKYGVLVDNEKQVAGIGGMINNMPVTGGNSIDVPNNVIVKGFTPGTNRVLVEFQYKDGIAPVSASIPMSQQDFSNLTGYIAPRDERKLHKAMRDAGVSSNSNYYNLLGKVPGFKGNIQYSFDPIENEKWEIKIKIPKEFNGGTKEGEKLLRTNSGYVTVDTWGQGETDLTQIISNIRAAEKVRNPDVSDLEIDKNTMTEFYKAITGAK